MKILAVDSSAVAASCCVWEDGRMLAHNFIHTRLTHSQTLLPMIDAMLTNAQIPLTEIGAFAVNAGPGSFTGIRIGVATVKGLAMVSGAPCVPVSTLEAMAWQLEGLADAAVCAAMDARCGQVYQAFFQVSGQGVSRLCQDRALPLERLSETIKILGKNIIFVGDGADLCYNTVKDAGLQVQIAPPQWRFQQACGVARCAARMLEQGKGVSPDALAPVYLRPSQAERERMEKLQAKDGLHK